MKSLALALLGLCLALPAGAVCLKKCGSSITDTGATVDCTGTEIQDASGTCVTDLSELNTSLSTGLVTGAHTTNAVGLLSALPGTCTAGDFYGQTDTLDLCFCFSTDTWSCSPLRVEEHFNAMSGGDAFALAITVDNYDVAQLSLSEVLDATGDFEITTCTDDWSTGGPPQTGGVPDGLCDSDGATLNASEFCYSGSLTLDIHIIASLSFERTSGAGGADTVTIAFGKNTTGAIDDGSEFGDEFERTLSNNSVIGMGAVGAATTLATDQCISLLWKSDGVSSLQMHAFTIDLEGL